MLETYFRLALKMFGYEGLEPAWSLGYCQGDGMAFHGKIHGERLRPLLRRVMPEMTEAQVEALVEDINFEVKVELVGHYTHENSMSVDLYDWGPFTDTAFENTEATMAELERRIDADVTEVARRLGEDGYALLEHTRPEDEEFCRSGVFRGQEYEVRLEPLDDYYDAQETELEVFADLQDYVAGRKSAAALIIQVDGGCHLYEIRTSGWKDVSPAEIRKAVREVFDDCFGPSKAVAEAA